MKKLRIRSAVDSVDNYRRFVWCEHLALVQNPLFSPTPNVAVTGIRTLYLVLEECKVKLLCGTCLLASTMEKTVQYV